MSPLPLRFLLTRLAVVTAAGALLTAAAVTRAVGTDGAGDTPAPSPTATPATTAPAAGTSTPSPTTAGGTTTRPSTTQPPSDGPVDGPADGSDNSPRFYRGVVTARGGLALRARPDRGSPVVRVARKGEVVWIHCKTPGQDVNGNPLWYLLADGAWSWGTARYIDNIGPAPRWC
ncbi:SH3 domain-containing protein [Streptomyces sp. NRRL S-813]|uniref:SH3 domain-containing protein n=1 Tax=Streptomyces sp. NRRL S-813 TaxID=1463919 RepID=UPI0004C16274|nr:SH3 domain-containing protein [Streptomyces sp. NRRL S-813]